MKIRKLILWFSLVLALALQVNALSLSGFAPTFNRIREILLDVYALHFIVFLLLFVLLYAIVYSGLKRVKSVGDGKEAKLIALTISAMGTFGIFFTTRNLGVASFLETLLGPFAVFAGLLVALVLFFIVYNAFKDKDKSKAWQIGLIVAGLLLVLFGGMLNIRGDNVLFGIGWLLAAIGLIFLLFSAFKGSGSGSSSSSSGSSGSSDNNRNSNDNNNNRDSNEAGPINNLQGQHRNKKLVDLNWDATPGAKQYEVQRRIPFWSAKEVYIPKAYSKWHTVANTGTNAYPDRHNLWFVGRRVIEYRVRVNNGLFKKGPWAYCRVEQYQPSDTGSRRRWWPFRRGEGELTRSTGRPVGGRTPTPTGPPASTSTGTTSGGSSGGTTPRTPAGGATPRTPATPGGTPGAAGPTPPPPAGGGPPPGHVPHIPIVPVIDRIEPDTAEQNSGTMTIKIIGSDLDQINDCAFQHETDKNYYIHQTDFPNFISQTDTEIELEIDLDQACPNPGLTGHKDCKIGKYNILFNYGPMTDNDSKDNVFEVTPETKAAVPYDVTPSSTSISPGSILEIYFSANKGHKFDTSKTHSVRLTNTDLSDVHDFDSSTHSSQFDITEKLITLRFTIPATWAGTHHIDHDENLEML